MLTLLPRAEPDELGTFFLADPRAGSGLTLPTLNGSDLPLHLLERFLVHLGRVSWDVQRVHVGERVARIGPVFLHEVLPPVTDSGFQVALRGLDDAAEPPLQRCIIHEPNATLSQPPQKVLKHEFGVTR